jgi:cytoskeletal protein CcmA (bactofilin family)
MFSKTKITDTTPNSEASSGASSATKSASASTGTPSFQAKPKASPSLLSNDLTIQGNITTSGDIQIEGTIEGDVRAHLLTVGESATIKGEIAADDVVVNGRVIGRLRGLKVRLTASAKVEGDIIHKTIAIESGAQFEGTVQRQDDPLGNSSSRPAAAVPASATAKPRSTENSGTPPMTSGKSAG